MCVCVCVCAMWDKLEGVKCDDMVWYGVVGCC